MATYRVRLNIPNNGGIACNGVGSGSTVAIALAAAVKNYDKQRGPNTQSLHTILADAAKKNLDTWFTVSLVPVAK